MEFPSGLCQYPKWFGILNAMNKVQVIQVHCQIVSYSRKLAEPVAL